MAAFSDLNTAPLMSCAAMEILLPQLISWKALCQKLVGLFTSQLGVLIVAPPGMFQLKLAIWPSVAPQSTCVGPNLSVVSAYSNQVSVRVR